MDSLHLSDTASSKPSLFQSINQLLSKKSFWSKGRTSKIYFGFSISEPLNCIHTIHRLLQNHHSLTLLIINYETCKTRHRHHKENLKGQLDYTVTHSILPDANRSSIHANEPSMDGHVRIRTGLRKNPKNLSSPSAFGEAGAPVP